MICFDRDTGDRSATIWDVRYLPRTAWRSTACAGEKYRAQFWQIAKKLLDDPVPTKVG
jgi:hypothetical protein